MSLPSPEPSSSSPAPPPGTVSPPSYTPAPLTPKLDEKIAAVPKDDEKIAIPNPGKFEHSDLPEVVCESVPQTAVSQHPDPQKNEHISAPPVSPSPSNMLSLHGDGAQSPPILQHPALQQGYQQQGYPQPGFQQPGQMGYSGHESMVVPSQAPVPVQPSYPPAGAQTVTPLHLLADQADTVDCPFCQRRTETRVKKESSGATHGIAAALFFTTVFGVMFPYICHCAPHISHYCKNCKRKVAYKQRGGEMEALGTPEHLREMSRFPAAEPKQKK
ncbi:hypothetical protein ACJ41O_003326 [Fusarium nematophilum]